MSKKRVHTDYAQDVINELERVHILSKDYLTMNLSRMRKPSTRL